MDPAEPSFRSLLVESTIDLLSELRDRTGMTAAIAVMCPDEQRGEVVASLPGLSDHGYVPRAGSRFHLHSTAPGKAMLSHLSPVHRQRIVNLLELTRFTKRTFTDAASLIAHLDACGLERWVFDVGEYVEGVNCVGSAVLDDGGRPLAAVWITSLSVELPESDLPRYAPQVISTANQMWIRLRDVNTSATRQNQLAMERAKQFIDQNFLDEDAVRNYHKTAGFSESWFRKLFREQHGKAPMSYRLQLLHHRARRLLQNTNLTVKEIAFQLGYDSQNYFSRAFKKVEGRSPAHFREDQRGL